MLRTGSFRKLRPLASLAVKAAELAEADPLRTLDSELQTGRGPICIAQHVARAKNDQLTSVSLHEFAVIMVRRSYRELRYLISWSLEDCPEFDGHVEVDGKINRIDEGIWHNNYCFWIRGRALPKSKTDRPYILRLLDQSQDWQQGPAPLDRLIREATTLQVLGTKTGFPHLTPRFICFVRNDESKPIGMIETALPGHSLQGHKDRSTLRLIGQVAADIHVLDMDGFSHLPDSGNRREHLRSRIAELDEKLFREFPLAGNVRDWIGANMPSGDPGCLLHGDLLPQNLLRKWPTADQQEPLLGVVDWEMAQTGDPAYDLAIVSRGDRKVLGIKDGLKVLLEHYLECGGKSISLPDVRLHELVLLLQWLEEAWREYQSPSPSGHGPDYYEDKLRGLFRRAVN